MIRYHRVRDGESLSDIAQAAYGDYRLWPLIWEHNQDVLCDPNHLSPGQELIIPHHFPSALKVELTP